MRILGVCGSLRRGSYNHFALEEAGRLMPEGMVLEMATLEGIPFYNQDVEDLGMPEAVLDLKARIDAADGVLFASPEYNFSVTGVLKNAIDWLSRCAPQPFIDKPVAILSATRGPFGGARNQYDLRKIMVSLEAAVLTRPEVLISLCHTKFDADGRLTDEATRQVMAAQLAAYQRWVRRFVDQPAH